MSDADQQRCGVGVQDLARALDRPEADIRELVRPQGRPGGFKRPHYLAYANATKTKLGPQNVRTTSVGAPLRRPRGAPPQGRRERLRSSAASVDAPWQASAWSLIEFPD